MMSGVGVAGCGERARGAERVESETEREREKGGSRFRFGAQETMQGWGVESVGLHRVSCVCVCVCARCKAQCSWVSGAELLNGDSAS